ncbi:uncharacterized protein [Typha latifolia]|uniref:uncharacterized protein n=1 Tax=Typha latifolia TaxID=4733 RepID=UPI003C2CD4CB
MDLHVFFLPFLAPGHMIPMVDLACLLAGRGVKSTVVTTAANIPLIRPTIQLTNSSLPSRFHPIQILLLPFPSSESGIPEGQENLLAFPAPTITPEIDYAIDLLQEPFSALLYDHRPDCVVSDIFYTWSAAAAHALDIPRLVFHGTGFFPCAVTTVIGITNPHLGLTCDDEPFVVPGLPHRVELTKAQLPDFFSTRIDQLVRMHDSNGKSDGMVMNSFYDMEPDYVDLLKGAYEEDEVWHVGPLSLRNKDATEKAIRGNTASINAHECLNWLDTKKARSVIYVCFGSLGRFAPAQLKEIALGLEASQHLFVWVVKYDKHLVGVLPDGFESRMARDGKGFVINGWAPQLLILNHEAIGGFVTHCGWNSCLEAASSGVPMVTWPLFAEQFVNERLVVQVLRIGVSVGVRRCSEREEEREVVDRDQLEKAVKALMGGGKEAEERRKRARELRVKAMRAVEEGGSSYNGVSHLIEHLVGLRAARVGSGRQASPCLSFSNLGGMSDQNPLVSSQWKKTCVVPPPATIPTQASLKHTSMDLHVFFLPFLAPGHMIPIVDLARLLADRGVKSTVVTTAGNLALIQPTIDLFNSSLPSHFHPIQILLLPFPFSESNLPQGQENLAAFPTPGLTQEFNSAIDLLVDSFSNLLYTHRPDCIISDVLFTWSADAAHVHGVPRLVFHGTGFFSCAVSTAVLTARPHVGLACDDEPFVVPQLPHRVELTRAQLPDFFSSRSAHLARINESIAKSDGIVMNSFYEMERDYVEFFKEAWEDKMWHVGPVSLRNKDIIEKEIRGNTASISTHECLSWLDAKKPKSIIYVCFGSLGRFTSAQLKEIALGLEASKYPFIWVVKYNEHLADILPEGFESRVAREGKGLIINGWAPQLLILNHKAVGGFVTHCGWNSCLEAVSSGVPMVTWPLFAEQLMNERLLVEVIRVGVPVGVRRCSNMEEDRTMVGREELEKAVVELMGEGEEAKERRKRARELAEKAKRAVEEGGSSYNEFKNS